MQANLLQHAVRAMDPYEDTDENCWLRANFSWLMAEWLQLPTTRENFHDFAYNRYDETLGLNAAADRAWSARR